MPDTTTTTRPTYGNWRLPSRPGIGPLGLLGTIVLLGGLITILLAALLSWIAAVAALVLVAGVTIPLAIRTADGRSGITIAAVRAGWAARRITGRDTYMSGPLSREPGGRFTPPGLLAGTVMLEGRDVYHRPFGVLHDQRLNTFTIVLECDPDGAALVDTEQVDTWVASWGGWLAGLAHEPGLLGAAVIVETAPDPGTRLAAEVLPRLDPAAPETARQLMAEVVAAYPAASSQTSTYVTLTYRPASAGGRMVSRADRTADMVTNLAIRISPLAAGLTAAGGGPARPMPADRIADAVRAAFDPSVLQVMLQARAETGSTGLRWKDAGPVTAQETGDSYFHEGAVSRTWVACEAPRGTVRSSVLRTLLEPSARISRKRVTLLYRPLDPATAARTVESDRRSAHFMAASTTGLVNARSSTAVRAAEQAATEEAAGAGLVEFAVVVTATADSAADLREADAEIANLAASARLRLRVARGQQAAAFTCALPGGALPWLHTLVPYQLRGAL
ncbi:MAG TPA: SCO6880 family protein [Streptosporangiaceae bacterium]|nr:SCO6880 family protein [Streptosporangiaceae bacterium]